ncbi:hypothetical protein DUI87_30554 [Hirundo rustica rustica]|uniref:Uncharacterized protein n=1 Tax=Hirundo rustica rustica TaxID=333673 RepID=A0A3M0IX53_HIRRU|nr:hypothetical protein DUI87_30554 [Hirundo rustica rustica]
MLLESSRASLTFSVSGGQAVELGELSKKVPDPTIVPAKLPDPKVTIAMAMPPPATCEEPATPQQTHPSRCRELSQENEATLGIQKDRAGAERVPVISGVQVLSQEMDFLEAGEALDAGPVEHQHHISEQLSLGRRKDFCQET